MAKLARIRNDQGFMGDLQTKHDSDGPRRASAQVGCLAIWAIGVYAGHRMLRVLAIAVTLVLSFNLSGLSAMCGEPPCDGCPQERSGECAPNCHSCACCSFPKTTPSDGTRDLIPPKLVRADWPDKVGAPPSTEPGDILHVPKLLPA